MAIKLPLITDYLTHNSPYIPLNGDWTVMVWLTPLEFPTGMATDYATYWFLANIGYDKYVGIFSGTDPNPDCLVIYATDGVDSGNSESNLNHTLLTNTYHATVTYDLSAQEVKFYINGTLVKTISSIDFTGVTSTQEGIGNDGSGTASNMVVQNYRSWEAVLTADEIALEIGSNTAVKLTNLFADTSFSDTTNASGWTLHGTPEDYTTYDVKFITGSANNSFGTALTVPYLPYKLVQNAKYSGTAVDLYYSFDAISSNNVVGAWAYSPNTTYNPLMLPYYSDETDLLGIGGQRVPIQFPVDGGSSYYLQVRKNGSPTTAINYLQIDYIGNATAQVGDLADPDDTAGFPMSIIREATTREPYNNVVTFKKPFPAGEQGDALDSGEILMVDDFVTGQPVYSFDSGITQQAIITSLPARDKFVRASNGQNLFALVVTGVNPSTPAVAYTVSPTGVLGATSWTLGDNVTGPIAANNDGTILYYTGVNEEIKRWDLTNNTALTDFLPLVSGHRVGDIIIDSDDTIFILYFKQIVTRDLYVRRYNAGGTLLDTYNYGTDHDSTLPRMSYSINNPTNFWVWTHSASDQGRCNFIEVNVSDGSEANNIPCIEFEGGVNQDDITPTPRARFGVSFSCPFFQLRESFVPPPANPLSGIYKIVPWSRKTNDTLYISLDPVETEDVAIPNPFIEGPGLGN